MSQAIREATQWLANVKLGWIIIFCIAMALIRWAMKHPFVGPSIFRRDAWRKHVGETAEALLLAVALVAFIIRPFLIQAFFIPSASMEPTLTELDRIIVNKLAYRVSDPGFGDIVVFSVEQSDTSDPNINGAILGASDPLKRTSMGVLFGESFEEGVTRKDFIKRCMAVPGDEIQISDGIVTRNGEPLAEGYTAAAPDYDFGTWKVAPAEVIGRYDPDMAELAQGLGQPGDRVSVSIWSQGAAVWINGELLGQDLTALCFEYSDELEMAPFKLPPDQYLMLGDNRQHSNDGHIWGTVHRSRIVGKAWLVFWPPSKARSLVGDWKVRE